MSEGDDPIYGLIVEIRGAFNELKAFADDANADLGVTAAMRAVLEHLAWHGPSTVPDIARTKSVSRQHIQKLADALVAASLARFEPNPAHKRSALLAPTGAGERTFATIRQREAGALARLGEGLDPTRCREAAETVAALRRALAALGQG
ncbi:MAG: MarR family winged helix-turn-helix transcriptional regulator [Paracoccaceae bacterium]|nr:MarR family winged helix-turn-helix transcriptional regulator [Paracoccaceae bacterium]